MFQIFIYLFNNSNIKIYVILLRVCYIAAGVVFGGVVRLFTSSALHVYRMQASARSKRGCVPSFMGTRRPASVGERERGWCVERKRARGAESGCRIFCTSRAIIIAMVSMCSCRIVSFCDVQTM